MITIKTPQDIEILREGGRRLAHVIREVAKEAKPGVATSELDRIAHALITKGGDTPSFLNYKPKSAEVGYPASICVSVNDEVVHGIPKTDKLLKDGDIVSIDIGLIHKELFVDAAITIPVGEISEDAKKLLETTEDALSKGIAAARGGNTTGDIGFAIQNFIKPYGYGIVEELCGHGVGYAVHEDPFVPNFGIKGRGARLKPGMVIAIEPMVNLGSKKIVLDKDGYTYRTIDGKLSAHFEHTILIGDGEPEILTKI